MQLLSNLSDMCKVERLLLDVRKNTHEFSFGMDPDREEQYVAFLSGVVDADARTHALTDALPADLTITSIRMRMSHTVVPESNCLLRASESSWSFTAQPLGRIATETGHIEPYYRQRRKVGVFSWPRHQSRLCCACVHVSVAPWAKVASNTLQERPPASEEKK